MKTFQLVLGTVALALATGAFAVPTASSYGFASPTYVTGASTWLSSQAGYNATSGSDYGNSITYASGGISNPVTATAWASTGGVGGYDGTLEQAFVSRYSSNGKTLNELAITSQPGIGNSSELTYSGSGTARIAVPNSSGSDPQHAIDNNGSYESMLFSFASAVTLDTVSIGYPSRTGALDSDATVLVYTGLGDPTTVLSTRTYAQLLSSGWTIAGNLSNLAATGTGTLSSTIASKYWMVGAYMDIGGNGAAMVDDGRDYFKISGLTATRAVPEPGSAALLGIAIAGLLASRRRKRAH